MATLLYLIEILHQTTTELSKFQCLSSCILSKFYIKPQHYPMLFVDMSRCILSKFYIKPQQTSYHISLSNCCILSKFYIKPQHSLRLTAILLRCILSKFYIKPQLYRVYLSSTSCCILSKFYIKPQRLVVESYSQAVVSYRNSTSNHNSSAIIIAIHRLYLIEILHQTTTCGE